MNHVWIQYAYDDPTNAPIIQTAHSEAEAREDNEIVMSGCCWYRYDTIDGSQKLINQTGPFYFDEQNEPF